MCSTTPKTKAASPGVKQPSTVQKPPALPKIITLQKFLTDQYNAEKTSLEPTGDKIGTFTLKNKEAAISIRAINNDNENLYGEINGTLMHYSASMIKVAAMYAAYDLLCTARIHAKNNSFTNKTDFQNSLDSLIDTSTAIQRLKDFGKGLKPDLSKIFVGFTGPGTNEVNFHPDFAHDMSEMILQSSDALAGNCIRKLGYSYINVSLIKGNFFNPDPNKLNGIWLAGDYSGEGILKSVRVPVENDTVSGGSGQATTTKEMSRMFHLIHTETALLHVTDSVEKAEANLQMHDFINRAPWWFDNNTSTVNITETLKFTRHCAKIGVGPLGKSGEGGPEVVSLGNVVTWISDPQIGSFNTKYQRTLTGDFAICWQNMYKPFSHFDSLVRLMNNSIENFLTQ